MPNFTISGTTNQNARVYICTSSNSDSEFEELLGYKDVTTGLYTIVVPETRPYVSLDDNFEGDNGDPPNTDKWDIIQGSPEIQDNKLYLEHPAGSGVVHEIRHKNRCRDDFYIKLAVDATGVAKSTSWNVQLSVLDESGLNGGRIIDQGSMYIKTYKVVNGVDTLTKSIYMGSNYSNMGIALIRQGTSWFSYRTTNGSADTGWGSNIGSNWAGHTDNVKVEVKSWHTGGLPAFDPSCHYVRMPTGTVILSGDVKLNLYAVVSGTGETSCYGDVEALETEDSVNISEYPWPL